MRAKEYLNVVLDIDETLIYFINKRYREHSWDRLAAEEKAKYDFTEDKHGNILIRRPHLKEFFQYLFENCSVNLWTLSDEEYAEGIANMILTTYFNDKPYKFSSIYCDKTDEEAAEYFGGRKNLKYFYEDPKKKHFWPANTILVDDLPANSVNAQNKANSITVKPFALFGEVKDRSDPYEDVSNDRVLLDVLDVLKAVISKMESQEAIFSTKNCKKYGLTHLLRNIELVNKKTGSKRTIKAIGVGESHSFKGGARKSRNPRKTRKRSSKH